MRQLSSALAARLRATPSAFAEELATSGVGRDAMLRALRDWCDAEGLDVHAVDFDRLRRRARQEPRSGQ